MNETCKIRISETVATNLSGTQAWQVPSDDDGYDGAAVSLMGKIQDAPRRKDGSCTVELTKAERDALYEYADVMAIGARDNIEPPGRSYGENWGLSEYNAASALLRQLMKIPTPPPL